MDWILERTAQRGLTGASLGDESFSDQDYADDVQNRNARSRLVQAAMPQSGVRF